MTESVTANLLVFSEEYVKVTKGMHAVWMSHVRGTLSGRHVDILLNREHWAFDETRQAFLAAREVAVLRLPFAMPSALLARIYAAERGPRVLRTGRLFLGQIMDVSISPLLVFYLWLLIRRIGPGAVVSHTGGWPAGPLGRWIIYAALLARVPKRILVIHNFPRLKSGALWSVLAGPLRRLRAWSVYRSATAIVAVSDSVKACLESEVFKRPVVRIHNGIGLQAAAATSGGTGPNNWQPAGPVIGFVGALYPLKGPHVLLDAFRLVRAPCELALLGPAEAAYLESLKQRASLCANKVSFLGYSDDVDGFMERIDFLVVPSIAFESFGMVILEAMRHSKAVICSDFGGMSEVVRDGVTGLVVSAGDTKALAAAMEALLSDCAASRRMGQAGYRRLVESFTAERMVQQYESLIGDL